MRFARIPALALAAAIFFSVPAAAQTFRLDLQKDAALLGTGVILNAAAYSLQRDHISWDGIISDKDNINAFDRPLAIGYSKALDRAGDVAVFLATASPAVLYATNSSEWKEISVMYAETLLFANGTKELLKGLVERKRPYMYFANPSEDGIDGRDWQDSFPSGHATFAFAGASFFSYVYCQYNPDSNMKIPVVAGSFALAAATSCFRMASGNHFASDVLAGAAIGCLSGIAIPWLHKVLPEQVCVTPQSVGFTLRW